MITDSDVKKLKKTFVTKDDSKKGLALIKNVDRKTNSMVKDIQTLIEIIGDTNKRIDEALQRIDAANVRIDATLDELKHDRIVLGNHEERIQSVERKIYPQI